MKEIPLRNKQKEIIAHAKVDDDVYGWITNWTWCLMGKGKHRYVMSGTYGKAVLMHRLIMGVTDPLLEVDHKDHDTLNNQQYNLRVGDKTNNQHNRTAWGKSKYLGVSIKYRKLVIDGIKTKVYDRWVAVIRIHRKLTHIGIYKTEIEAALAYDRAAKQHRKEWANLNFKEEVPTEMIGT
jgi:hypothetical protein